MTSTPFARLLILPLLLMLLSGCNDGGDGEDGGSSTPEAPTVNIAGTWTGTCTANGESRSATVTIRQDGNAVKVVEAGEVDYVGTLSGNTLTLTANIPTGEESFATATLSGPVEGDSIKLSGTIKTSDGGLSISVPVSCDWTRSGE